MSTIRLRLLLVEDSATDADLLARMVSKCLPEASLQHVERLSEALEVIRTQEVDVVLIDLSLSDSRGLDTVRQLIGHEATAVVVLTGNEDESFARETLKLGAQDYLSKNQLEPRLLARCLQYAFERKQSDRVLRQKDARLLQKQRIEALGEMAGGVAHEFNNLLQIIQTYGSFVIEGLDEEDQAYRDLQEILSAADRAARLTSQLLGFSRRRSLQCAIVNANEVVSQLLKMLRPLLGEHIEVTLALDDRVGALSVDETMFEQMLTNICLNSRDALPHGGDIHITTHPVELTLEYAELHSNLEPGHYVAITVSDNGCGMSSDVINKVFDPFFTTKEVGKGTGLGLSMVYGVVKQHNGAINIYSEPGLGTTVRMYLPAITDEQSAPQHVGSTDGIPGGSETILLAEDEPGVRRAAQRILERAGYSVLEACDGEEAVRIFEKSSELISAVILDAIMPKLMGRHVYEAIRIINPAVPVLFCTGFDKETGLFDFVAREGLPILTKPFQPAALLQAVRQTIDAPPATRQPAEQLCLSEL